MMKRCLVVFSKEPQEGRVKTRLQDYLSQAQCVNLYKAFLKDTLKLARNIDCDFKILAYESQGKYPHYLKKVARHLLFIKQKGKDLGERMYNAFKFARDNGASKTVIIGSDSPTLPARSIEKAFNLLDTSDVVLGPSLDGGYYLIGLKRPCLGIFQGIKWSSQGVLEYTVKNVRRLKKTLALLNRWYDVDEPKDLIYLRQHLNMHNNGIAQWTRKFFE